MDNDHDLAILVSGGGAVFSNSDVTGTWTIEAEGDSPDSNGMGTLSFDGNGHILGGTIINGGGTDHVTGGDYTVNADGTLTAHPVSPGGNGTPHTLTLTGAMNGSKDFVALNPASLQGAIAGDDTLLVAMVKPAGKYSLADGAACGPLPARRPMAR